MEVLLLFLWFAALLTIFFCWNGLSVQLLVSQSAIILGILCIRFFLRGKIRAGAIHGMWFLLVLRLLVSITPFSFLTPDNPLSINRTVNAVISSVTNIKEQDGDAWKNMDTEPIRFDLADMKLPFEFKLFWLAGAIVFCLIFSLLNERFRRKLYRSRVRLDMPDYPCPVYRVPDTLSCVIRIQGKTGIYLSEEVANDKERRNYVLSHEISHLKHHDLLWAWVRNFMLAIFWFHPLMWVAAILSKRDNETACDERTLERLDANIRRRYGEVLIDLVDTSFRKEDVFYLATTMTSGKRELKQRIRAITGKPRNKLFSTLMSFLLSFLLITIGFTTYMPLVPQTPEEVIRHFYYYEAKENVHGVENLYPSGHFSNLLYGRRLNDKVIRIQKITDVTETDAKAFDYVPPKSQYADLKIYQANIVREISDSEKPDSSRIEKCTEYFLVVREKGEHSWRIEDWE